MSALIDSFITGVPALLVEVAKLGRTLKERAADVLAHFDPPGTSNGPTEAIDSRLECLRGTALGFRNLTNTSPDRSAIPAASDCSYTLIWDEPDFQ